MNCVMALKVVCCVRWRSRPKPALARQRQAAKHQRNAAMAVEEIDQRVADIVLVEVEAAARRRGEFSARFR